MHTYHDIIAIAQRHGAVHVGDLEPYGISVVDKADLIEHWTRQHADIMNTAPEIAPRELAANAEQRIAHLNSDHVIATPDGALIELAGPDTRHLDSWVDANAPAIRTGAWTHHHKPHIAENPYNPPSIHPDATVDPTARIEPGATIDRKATIGPYATVNRGAHIGAHTTVEAGAYIAERTRIGTVAQIASGAYVGPDSEIGFRCRVGPGSTVPAHSNLAPNSILGAGQHHTNTATAPSPGRSPHHLAGAVERLLALDHD